MIRRNLSPFILFLALFFTLGCGRVRTPGELNKIPFGPSGSSRILIGNYQENRGDKLQNILPTPDGKIIAAGTTSYEDTTDCKEDPIMEYVCRPKRDGVLLRFSQDSSLDKSFDGDGQVFLDQGFEDYLLSAALQQDGKIVVFAKANETKDANIRDYLTRINTDGSLDKSFGTEGIRLVLEKDCGFRRFVAVTSDEKILTASNLDAGGILVHRFLKDGTPDTSFGNNGVRATPSHWRLEAFHLDAGNSLFLAGKSSQGTEIIVAKLDAQGNFSSDFANGKGWLDIDDHCPPAREVTDIVADRGKVAVALKAAGSGEPTYSNILMLTQDGSVDARFASNGRWDLPDFTRLIVQGIRFRNDGKLWVLAQKYFTHEYYRTLLNSDGSGDKTAADSWTFLFYSWAVPSFVLDAAERLVLGASSEGYLVTRYTKEGNLDHYQGADGPTAGPVDRGAGLTPRFSQSRFDYPR